MISSSCSPSRREPCNQMSRKTRCGRRAPDEGQGLVRVARRTRAVPFVGQDTRHDLTNIGLIVHDKNVRRHEMPQALSEMGSAMAGPGNGASADLLRGKNSRTRAPRP